VGEIDHPHDPEDQGEADAEQRVRAPQHDAVEPMLQDLIHALLLSLP
jgi:hypothetical protein